MNIISKLKLDNNWIGTEVLIFVGYRNKFSGILRGFDDGWIDINGVIFNTDKIISISKLECKCRDR